MKKNKGRALSDEATALDEDEVSPETPFLTDDSFESITDQVPEHIYDSVVEYENVLVSTVTVFACRYRMETVFS